MVNNNQTIRELKAIGSQLGIHNYGRLVKEQLIQAINQHLEQATFLPPSIQPTIEEKAEELSTEVYVTIGICVLVLRSILTISVVIGGVVGISFYYLGKKVYQFGKWYRPRFVSTSQRLMTYGASIYQEVIHQYRTKAGEPSNALVSAVENFSSEVNYEFGSGLKGSHRVPPNQTE